METLVVGRIGNVVCWVMMSYFLIIFVALMGVWVVESRIIQRVIDGTRHRIREMGAPMFLLFCAFAVAMSITAQKRAGDGGNFVRGLDPTLESGVEPSHRGGASGPSRVVFQSARSFAFNGGGPICFTNVPDVEVQTVMLAVRADPADLATLVDAPETARLRIAQTEGWTPPGMTPTEQSLTGQFLDPWTGDFFTDWLVAEITFDAPVALASLRFGNSAGRPEWDRVWRGGIKGIVCFNAPLDSEDVRAGVANWLALRGQFGKGHPYAATPAQRQAAIEAGLKSSVDWVTVIVIR